MADDHGLHKAEAARRLAGQHGDVLIIHGGGTIAVGQPVNTDLNQHVKRVYMAAETAELLKQMRHGKRVPQLRRSDCVDLMVDVLGSLDLHIQAAGGFLKTGIRAPSDKTRDAHLQGGGGFVERGKPASESGCRSCGGQVRVQGGQI